MKKKETIINLLVGVISNVVLLIMGLIIPRLFMTRYGSDVNGLIGTITQIFAYVALLEAGISQATMNALYEPVKKDDKDSIQRVLSVSRQYYRRITMYYGMAVLLLSLILPFALKSGLDYKIIFFSVLFEGFSGVVSFYFIQTPSIYVVADGKTYIKSIIELAIKVLGYGAKIVLAVLGFNIVFVQLAFFLLSLLKLLIYRIIMQKKYPWLKYEKIATKNVSLPNRNSFLVTEIAWTIFSSTDLIVLSTFASTKLSSVYSVNNIPFLAINNLLNAAYYAIYYHLGKSYYSGIDKYRNIHDTFNSIFMGAITICVSVVLLLSTPFISLYTTGVKDIDYNLHWLPLCFCIIQMLSWSRYISGNLTGIAGYAKQVSKVSFAEAIINLLLSILLVNFFDVYGVAVATIVALPLKVLYTNYISEVKIMQRSAVRTLCILFVNYAVFAGVIVFREFVYIRIDNYYDLILYGFIACVMIGIPVVILNVVVNQYLLSKIKSIVLLRKKG